MKKLLVLLLLLSLLSTTACGENTQSESSLAAESSVSTPESSEASLENESDEVIEDNFKAGYIDFIGDYYGMDDEYEYHKFPNKFPNKINLVFLENYEDFIKYCEEAEFIPGESFTEEYFEENAVIFAFFTDGSTTPQFTIKNIYADENRNVTVTVRYTSYGGGDAALQLTTLVAKVKKADLNNVATLKCVYEYMGTRYNSEFPGNDEDNDEDNDNDENSMKVNFITHRFDGRIENDNRLHVAYSPTTVEWPEVARNIGELKQIADRYKGDVEYTAFTDYVASLDQDFFEKNIILAYSYSCIYNNCFVDVGDVILYEGSIHVDIKVNNRGATEFEDSEEIIVIEVPKLDWPESMSYTTNTKMSGYTYTGELNSIDFTPYVMKLDLEPQGGSNAALSDSPGNLTTYAAHNKEGLIRVFKNALFFNDLSEEPIASFLEQFDDEFFKDNALLIGRQFFLDKGEDIKITKVKRVKQPYTSNIDMQMTVEIDDRVQPSSNENMECYICVAAIEKNEMVGMETSGKLTIK